MQTTTENMPWYDGGATGVCVYVFLANRVGGASGRKPLYLWPWHTHLVVQATLTRRQWLLRQEAHLGGASVHGWEVQQMCFFPAQVASKQRPTLLSTQIKWTALPCQGPNGVCKHASMQHQTSCQRLGSSSGVPATTSAFCLSRKTKCGSQAGHQNQVLFRRPIRSESESWGRSPSTTPTCSTMFPWGACR